MATREYRVSGMSCGHCEEAVRGEVARLPGVEGVEVDAQSGRLVVTSAAPVDDGAVLGAVDEAGFQAVVVA